MRFEFQGLEYGVSEIVLSASGFRILGLGIRVEGEGRGVRVEG